MSQRPAPTPPLTPDEVAAALPVGEETNLDIDTAGQRTFPPPVSGTLLPLPDSVLSGDETPEIAQRLSGYVPEGLPLRPMAPRMDPALIVPHRVQSLPMSPDARIATTVFAPDDRRIFSDTSFPWRAMGRVDTAGGYASGVLVGPRHILTASHAVIWNADGTSGWLRFTPSYFDGNEPFGHADAIHWYAYRKVTPPDIDPDEARFDYAVLVLNARLGDTVGFIGSRGYDDSWDGSPYWTHVGYPGDLAGGKRPCYQASIALDGSDTEPDTNEEITHKGDVWPGQSGGPFFAWWSGEPWPRAVAVQSWQNTSANGASGGSYIPNLINLARSEFP